MKKTFYFFGGVLLSLCLCFSTNAKANKNDDNSNTSSIKNVLAKTNTVCFNDGFYNWFITYSETTPGTYSASGYLDVDGVHWSVSGWGSFAHRMGDVDLTAHNPNADNCQSGYVDSLTYTGTASISGNGSSTTFNGSGSWVNYCGGVIYNTGTWSAAGPCSASLQSKPYGPAKHAKVNTEGKNASNTVCFSDGYYNWKITYTDQGNGSYWASGYTTVDGVNWPVYGWGSFAHKMGSVELHASNPDPDGCTVHTDSFTYVGTAEISGNGSGTSFTGNGNWTSYCYGGVYANGTWSASGPCSNSLQSLPYGPAKHGKISDAKNASNSVCFNDGYYNWKITYTDQGNGNYSVTGSLNVDGYDWSVYGWGSFAQHMGSVEFHASNPNPDGCTSYTDSFTYWGNAQITGNGPNTSYTGSGTWTSYCYGGVLNTGTWSAWGPCSNSLQSKPYGPAKHQQAEFSMKLSPNPMKNISNVNYNLAKDAKVNITVYNFMQQPVKQIVNKTESAGKHSYVIDGSSLISGTYRVVAIVDGKTYSSTLQVVK
ncbi:MAG: T9SS type A sorting domain-containing protein [Bacteroidetes bacterium]|nr:T9SS type A sorting domain-containing protein [Bacteroidota bacterium]